MRLSEVQIAFIVPILHFQFRQNSLYNIEAILLANKSHGLLLLNM